MNGIPYEFFLRSPYFVFYHVLRNQTVSAQALQEALVFQQRRKLLTVIARFLDIKALLELLGRIWHAKFMYTRRLQL
jgi:hypothetical protein